jgi:DnaJ-class molecular chaperone
MRKNYYIIMGIPLDSTQTDIKAAYRRLAKEFHPDHYGENHGPFQDLQEAYTVLSDPESRRTYDKSLQKTARKQQPQHEEPLRRYYEETIEPLVPDGAPFSFNRRTPQKSFHHSRSLFDSMFDQLFGNFNAYRQPENNRFEDVTIEITLSPAQAQNGGHVGLKIPVQRRCPSCHGYGNPGYYNCRRCNGAGILSGEKTVWISYPPGIMENHSIQFYLRPDHTKEVSLTACFKIR